MSGSGELAQLSRRGQVSLVAFHPAQDGTISTKGASALAQIIERELGDDDVRAIVLTGARDGIFIRHANLAEIGRAAAALSSGVASEEDFAASPFATLCTLLDRATKPVIAAINGDCMGGGFEIALACTMRIASASVKSIGLPEIRIGIPPGAGGPQRLARLVGGHRARLFTLEGTVVGASEADALGIVDAVAENAVAAAIEKAHILAGRSATAIAEIMGQMRPTDDESIRGNILGFARCLTTNGISDAFARLGATNVAIEHLD